ncbi:MAG: hypothetical protein ACOX17_03685 [Christensenellales bacterium]|jgi:hypothetical protein
MSIRVLEALSGMRIPRLQDEYALHRAVAERLTEAGISFTAEAVIGPRCRIDFLAEGVGIEVKMGRPTVGRLREQLTRYALCPEVEELILLLEKSIRLPPEINGKRVTVMSLNSLWGIALP